MLNTLEGDLAACRALVLAAKRLSQYLCFPVGTEVLHTSPECTHALAGGLPGPQFQALPEPAPLPPLPRPGPELQMMPADAMAPMSAMAGESQPGAQLQVCMLTFYTLSISTSLPASAAADRGYA